MINWCHLKKVKSTQDIAKKILKESGGRNWKYVCVSTDNQFQGRGRSNKVWQHSEGNICASFGFKFQNFERLPFIQHLTALTLVKIMDNPDIRIKWPNDLYSVAEEEEKKIGGILVESENFENFVTVVIGIGLNTASSPNKEFFGTIGEDYFEKFGNENRNLLENFIENFDEKIEKEFPKFDFFDEYTHKMLWVGKKVALFDDQNSEKITGKLLGLNPKGGVNLLEETTQNRIEISRMMSMTLKN